MNTTDPIADLLTRIRNAHMARHRELTLRSSKMLAAIARVLEQEGYIEAYEVVQTERPTPDLKITLRYDSERQPSIRGIKRVSKPGLRVYTKRQDIPHVLGGLGTAILSTPKGVMTGRQAFAQQMGGEVLCFVY